MINNYWEITDCELILLKECHETQSYLYPVGTAISHCNTSNTCIFFAVSYDMDLLHFFFKSTPCPIRTTKRDTC